MQTRLKQDLARRLLRLEGRVAVNAGFLVGQIPVVADDPAAERPFRDIPAVDAISKTGLAVRAHPLAPGAVRKRVLDKIAERLGEPFRIGVEHRVRVLDDE